MSTATKKDLSGDCFLFDGTKTMADILIASYPNELDLQFYTVGDEDDGNAILSVVTPSGVANAYLNWYVYFLPDAGCMKKADFEALFTVV